MPKTLLLRASLRLTVRQQAKGRIHRRTKEMQQQRVLVLVQLQINHRNTSLHST